jgi:hypothetical protein
VVDEADTNNFFNCSFSHEDLLQIEQHQHNSHHNQIKLSDQLEFSEDTLTFTYDEQNCFLNQSSLFLLEDSSSKCKWVTTIIGVKNLNQDNHKIHYMLTLHG